MHFHVCHIFVDLCIYVCLYLCVCECVCVKERDLSLSLFYTHTLTHTQERGRKEKLHTYNAAKGNSCTDLIRFWLYVQNLLQSRIIIIIISIVKQSTPSSTFWYCDTMSWIYAHTCIHTCVCVHLYMCACVYIYIYTPTHMCVHTHTPTYTHTHTHIHTYTCGKMS